MLLALIGEVGELSEIFQWMGHVAVGVPDWKPETRVHLGEELADCLSYLIRLSDRCAVDLAAYLAAIISGNKMPQLAVSSYRISDISTTSVLGL